MSPTGRKTGFERNITGDHVRREDRKEERQRTVRKNKRKFLKRRTQQGLAPIRQTCARDSREQSMESKSTVDVRLSEGSVEKGRVSQSENIGQYRRCRDETEGTFGVSDLQGLVRVVEGSVGVEGGRGGGDEGGHWRQRRRPWWSVNQRSFVFGPSVEGEEVQVYQRFRTVNGEQLQRDWTQKERWVKVIEPVETISVS